MAIVHTLYTMKRIYYISAVFLLLFSRNIWASEQNMLVSISPQEAKEYDISTLLELAEKNSFKDLQAALMLTDIALEKAQQTKNKVIEFEILRTVGFFYEQHNQLDIAIRTYQKAMENAEARNNIDHLKSIYTDLGIVNRRLANYKESKDFHLKALELAQSLDNTAMMETSYHNLGSLYKDVNDYETAITYYLKAIELTEARGDTPNVINTKQYIANTYAESGNVDFGLKTIKEAYEMSLEVKDSVLIGIVLFDFGKILSIDKRYEEALNKFEASLIIFESIQHKPLIARTLFYMADAYAEQGHLEMADLYFSKCLVYDNYISLKSFADLYNKMGNLYLKKGQTSKAKTAFEKSLDIAQENEFKAFSQKSHYGLYEIFMEEAAYETAVEHLQASVKLKDALSTENRAKQIAELQFKYDVEKGEREIQALELKQNRFMLIGGAILSSILVLFLVYIVRLRGRSNRKLLLKNKEIQEQNIKLKESNEVLQQFTYVAAHDLKEPLRTIGSFVNLLQKRYGHQLDENANEYMTFVVSGVKRMNNLLISLLEYSTISIQKPSKDLINVKTVIQEITDNLQNTISAKNAIVSYPSELPALQMNKLHITQLFQNLISNGLKFTDQTPLIEIEGRKEAQQIVYSVKDNGIGMNKNHAGKVFNLFHQLNKNSHYEGTGIGLTICKNIVDKYDGKIWFESRENEGTQFFVSFPMAYAA